MTSPNLPVPLRHLLGGSLQLGWHPRLCSCAGGCPLAGRASAALKRGSCVVQKAWLLFICGRLGGSLALEGAGALHQGLLLPVCRLRDGLGGGCAVHQPGPCRRRGLVPGHAPVRSRLRDAISGPACAGMPRAVNPRSQLLVRICRGRLQGVAESLLLFR